MQEIKSCIITSSPENYVCVNELCSKVKSQHEGCYKCLVDKHQEIKQLHLEEIIEKRVFYNKIKQNAEEKQKIITKLIEDCNQRKKSALQQQEQIIQEGLRKKKDLEQQYDNFLINLQEEELELSLLCFQNQEQNYDHQRLLHQYYQKIDDYSQELNYIAQRKFENLNQSLCSKSQVLEDKCQQQEKQPSQQLQQQKQDPTKNNQYFPLKFVLALILLIIFSLFMLFRFKQEQNQVYNNYQQSSTNQQQEFFNRIEYNNQLVGKIKRNLNVNQFNNFKVLYDEPFDRDFTNDLYEKIKQQIEDINKTVCIGAKKDSNLYLIGCDLASEIFQQTQNTQDARKSRNGDIYWYWVKQKSFGFAPNTEINLNKIDLIDEKNQYRFSYGSTRNNDDRRIGNLIGLEKTKQFNLIIYVQKYG